MKLAGAWIETFLLLEACSAWKRRSGTPISGHDGQDGEILVVSLLDFTSKESLHSCTHRVSR
jgi:hypothetical protein